MGPIVERQQVFCPQPNTADVCRNIGADTPPILPVGNNAGIKEIGPTDLGQSRELQELTRESIIPIADGNIDWMWDVELAQSRQGEETASWNGLSLYFEQELRAELTKQDPEGSTGVGQTLIDVGVAGLGRLGENGYTIHRFGYVTNLTRVAETVIEYASSRPPDEIARLIVYQEAPQTVYSGGEAYALMDESIIAQGGPSDTVTIDGGLRIYKLPQEEDGEPELVGTLLDYGREDRSEYLIQNKLIALGDRLITLSIKNNTDGKSVLIGVLDPENPDSLDMHEYPMSGTRRLIVNKEEGKICITTYGYSYQNYIEIKSGISGAVEIEEILVPNVNNAIEEKYPDEWMSYVPFMAPTAIVSEKGNEYTLYALGYGISQEGYQIYSIYNLRLVKNNDTGEFEIMRGEDGEPLVDRIELDTSPFERWQIDGDIEDMQMHIINHAGQHEEEKIRTIVLSMHSGSIGLMFAGQLNPSGAEGNGGRVNWININTDLAALGNTTPNHIDIEGINSMADGKFAVHFETEAGSYIAVYKVEKNEFKLYIPFLRRDSKPNQTGGQATLGRRKAGGFWQGIWKELTDFEHHKRKLVKEVRRNARKARV